MTIQLTLRTASVRAVLLMGLTGIVGCTSEAPATHNKNDDPNSDRVSRETLAGITPIAPGIQPATSFSPTLVGTIQEVDRINSNIVVLGKPIQVTDETQFVDKIPLLSTGIGTSSNTINNLFVGDRVQVTFYNDIATESSIASELIRQNSSLIFSTLLNNPILTSDDPEEEIAEEDEFEVEGEVTAFDPATNTVVIEGVTIDYTNAEELDEILDVDLTGLIVEAEGIMEGEVLLATELEIEDMDDEGTGVVP